MKRLSCLIMLFAIVAAVFSNDSWGGDPITNAITLTCRTDHSRNILVHKVSDGDSIELVEFEFGASPFVPSHFSCMKWVSDLYRQKWFKGIKDRLLPVSLIGPDSKGKGRLPFDTAWKVYQFCAEDKDCRIRFPFNMGPWTPQGLWNRYWSNKSKTHSECLISPVEKERSPLSLKKLPSKFKMVSGKDIRFWSTKNSDLASQIIKVSKKSHTVLISTMTVSESQVRLLRKHLNKLPNLKIYIIADFSVMSTDIKFSSIFKLQTDRLRILPAFNFPEHSKLYHIKGAVAIGDDEEFFIHTSANLKGTGGSKMMDLGFVSKEKGVVRSFSKVYFEEAQNFCRNINYFKCSLDARLQAIDSRKFLLEGSAQGFCGSIFSDPHIKEFGNNKNRHFLLSHQYEFPDLLIEEMDRAKVSIEIVTHRFTHLRIRKKLEEMSKRGVKVILKEGAYSLDSKTVRGINRIPGSVGDLIIHSKAMIIDRKRMVWGSGNFSVGGLETNRELFFFTESKKLIERIRRLINSK